MANIRQANSHYVDATGVLVSDSIKLAGVIVTSTAANAVVEIADSAGTTLRLLLDVADSGASQHFDFSQHPLLFPNGIKIKTLTNAKAMLIYT